MNRGEKELKIDRYVGKKRGKKSAADNDAAARGGGFGRLRGIINHLRGDGKADGVKGEQNAPGLLGSGAALTAKLGVDETRHEGYNKPNQSNQQIHISNLSLNRHRRMVSRSPGRGRAVGSASLDVGLGFGRGAVVDFAGETRLFHLRSSRRTGWRS